MDKYRILQVIGEGTYGKVFKAQERETGRVVAIKKFKQREEEDPHVKKTMMREIRILREQRHNNIVNLIEHFREKGKLYLVFDFIPKTLLEELQGSPDGLTFDKIRSITFQILMANNYLHESNIIHRDIKPENLLISKAGLVKVCDFGFARPLNSSPSYQYTDYVSTRWYRAPELLVGDAAYSGTVDVWAIGCIFSEIFNGMPLFPGDSDLHTLQLILETVTADDMEHEEPIQELSKKQRVAFRMNPLFDNMKVPLASEAIKTPETVQEVSLKSLLKGITATQLDFLRKCLIIDGAKRATLPELLVHPIFDEEFRAGFDAKVEQMKAEDEQELQKLMKQELKTKDGRMELSAEDLITEEEDAKSEDSDEDDDEDDDEEEDAFRDDDSSSAVASADSSEITPASSSGIPPVNKFKGQLETQDIGTEEGIHNTEGSIKTRALPLIGEGLQTPADVNSETNLICQNSLISLENNTANTNKNEGMENGKASSTLSAEIKSLDKGSNIVVLSKSKKDVDSELAPALQTPPMTAAADAKEEAVSKNAPVKENNGQRVVDEQFQNKTNSQKQQLLPKAQPSNKDKGWSAPSTTTQVFALSSKPQTLENSETVPEQDEMAPKLEPIDISVKLQSSPAHSYYDINQTRGPSQSENNVKVHKRTSLNHYMIESSITEEVREENISEKTSSEPTSDAKPSLLERDDHVILQEGGTSMFQHQLVSQEDTEQGSARGVTGPQQLSPEDDDNKNQKAGLSKIKLGAQIVVKEGHQAPSPAKKPNGNGLASPINSNAETKATYDLKSAELRNTEESGTPEIRDSVNAHHEVNNRVGSHLTAANDTGFNITAQINSNCVNVVGVAGVAVIHQNTESTTRQNSSSNGPLLIHKQNSGAAGSKSKGQAAPQISKVNITFGSTAGQPVQLNGGKVNVQVNSQTSKLECTASRQSSVSHMNTQQIVGTNHDSLNVVPPDVTSSRAAPTLNGGISVQRSTISLKQAQQTLQHTQQNNTSQNQTARDITPRKQSQQMTFVATPLQQQAKPHSFGINGYSMAPPQTQESQFGVQPTYLQKYPKTQVKGPGPKQMAVLQQTSSLEKFDRNKSPQRFPNLKPMNSSMAQYGPHIGLSQAQNYKPTLSDEQRIGEGLISLQQHHQNRQGHNSINTHFSSQQQQRYGVGPQQMTQQPIPAGTKLASGSTQSLKTKMNFSGQNYHRGSNSQSNEPVMLASGGKQASITFTDSLAVVAATSAKKSQLIQPLKLVAFPKLSMEEGHMKAASPSSSLHGISTNQPLTHTGYQAHTLTSTLVGSKQKTVHQAGLFSKTNKPGALKKPGPSTIIQQQHNQQQLQHQLTSKTQANRMPKRYSEMGMVATGSISNNSKFAYIQGSGQAEQLAGDHQANFHPTLTNEYMLSQDSLVLNDVNSRPSRQSSKNVIAENQVSMEVRRPRNQAATSHLSSNQKSRTDAQISQIGNQSFHSTMKSKNNKFIHQNSSQSKATVSVNSSAVANLSKATASHSQGYQHTKPPNTSDKKVHQHFLEELSEMTSQRQSMARSKHIEPLVGGVSSITQSTTKQTPATSLFQKSKFFQSNSSNVENNPNSLNMPGNLASQQNHYGQYQQQQQSPSRTLHSGTTNDVNNIRNFTEKDSFPRRNITNKLMNANHKQQNRPKFMTGGVGHGASAASSPSPLSFYQNKRTGETVYKNTTNQGGVILPNLGTSGTGNPASNTAPTSSVPGQHPVMQVSLTQLRTTVQEQRNSMHLSQSPNIKSSKKSEQVNRNGQQWNGNSNVPNQNVVQLNASEFNLRLTNSSQLSGGTNSHVPYQQIVRKPPSVIQPGRQHQYQMYMTPSQNYTSGNGQSIIVNRANKNKAQNINAGASGGSSIQVNKAHGSSPTALSKNISRDNSLQVHKFNVNHQGSVAPANQRSPVLNGGAFNYKVKTETDWHRGSQQLIEVNSLGNSNQLYHVNNQFMDKSISPHRIQQAMKRGSNAQILSSQVGIAVIGGKPTTQASEQKNQSTRRHQAGRTSDVGATTSTGIIINDSSKESLPVQSPNILRKKIISKQQNQIK